MPNLALTMIAVIGAAGVVSALQAGRLAVALFFIAAMVVSVAVRGRMS